MKKVFLVISILLLLFNTSGAFYGGLNLLFHPDGSSLQMPLSFLDRSPFTSYLIPGIILFCVNGIFGIFTLLHIIFKSEIKGKYILIQGVLLTGWIIVQMMMIPVFSVLQLVYGIIGIILILSGWMISQPEKDNPNSFIQKA